MAIDMEARPSRRHLLSAGLGAIGTLIAGRLSQPDVAAATQGDTVTVGGTFQGTDTTSIENTADGGISLRGYHATNGTAVWAETAGAGTGMRVIAHSAAGARGAWIKSLDSEAMIALSETTTPVHPGRNAAVVAVAGDDSNQATDVSETGVYGFCDTSPTYAAGVWGDTQQGVGVVGTGDWGVFGGGNVGVYAVGSTALYTVGKVQFAGRSGHSYVAAGHKYKDVAIAGMTSGADGIAVLRSHVVGYYVSAVVSYAGKIRVYLNKTAGSKIYFNYMVLN